MAGLDLDRIAAAAIAVVDEHGPEGLNMRAVADALGVTPMALYHHVEHKAALVALLVDASVREEPLPVPGGLDWRQDLLDMARWTRRVSWAHPGIGQLRSQYKVWTPSALTLGEHWVNLWQRSGLDTAGAVWAAAASSVAIIGLVNEQILFREFEPPNQQDLAWRPNLRMLYEAAPDPDEVFDLVVGSVIDGVHARVSQRRAAPSDRLDGDASLRSRLTDDEVPATRRRSTSRRRSLPMTAESSLTGSASRPRKNA